MAEVGLLIIAKDSASKTMKSIGDSAKKFLKSTEETANQAKKSFDLLGGAVTAVNQAAELGKKAWEVARFAIADTVRESLQFRKESDPIIKWFADFNRSARRTRAEVGNIMIPIIKGLAEGLGLVGDGIADWIAANRKLVASGVLDWLSNVGNVLISSVGAGAYVVVDAWYAWEKASAVVETGVNAMFASILSGTSSALDAVGRLAGFFGNGELATSLAQMSEDASALGVEFENAGIQSAKGIEVSSSAFDEYKAKINEFTGGALDTWHGAVVLAQDEIAKSARATRTALDETSDAVKESANDITALAARLDAFVSRRADARDRMLKDQEAAVKASEASQAASMESLKEVSQSVSQTIVQGFFDQEDAAKGAAKGAAVAVIDAVSAKLAAYALEAEGGAIAGFSSIPVVGPALGIAAGAALSGVILALGAGLKGLIGGLADGGVIGGGIIGRDSVPALLMPGEQVMSVNERQGVQKFLGRLFGDAPSGVPQSSQYPSDGGNITINQNVLTPDQLTWDRVTRNQVRSFKRLGRQRILQGV